MSKPRRRATTHDVAAEAGVSQPTVSLVLSGNPRARVAAATRRRVIEAASRLGYQPNMLARGLVTRRSYALGVVVPDLDNPFFTEVVSGAQRVAVDAGYAVLLCDARGASAADHVTALRGRLVDGIILDAGSAGILSLQSVGDTNVVVVDEPASSWPTVASDAREAGRIAGRLLIELGHRTIAFLGPAIGTHTFRMRERGFVEALREAGLTIDSHHLRRVPASVAGGARGMQALLSMEDAPTACFCVNDLVGIGALKACLSAGVPVPERMSIVGCDDIEMARIVTPELTTVRIPAREMGARAARLLISQIEQDSAPRSDRLLPVKLIERQTTAHAFTDA